MGPTATCRWPWTRAGRGGEPRVPRYRAWAAALVPTAGNPDCHVILRGGSTGPNYDARAACMRWKKAGLPQRLVVDASHGNSDKDHRRQPDVIADIADRVAAGDCHVVGVMLESFLVPGRQDARPCR